jgi:hypothetical protein
MNITKENILQNLVAAIGLNLKTIFGNTTTNITIDKETPKKSANNERIDREIKIIQKPHPLSSCFCLARALFTMGLKSIGALVVFYSCRV